MLVVSVSWSVEESEHEAMRTDWVTLNAMIYFKMEESLSFLIAKSWALRNQTYVLLNVERIFGPNVGHSTHGVHVRGCRCVLIQHNWHICIGASC